MAGIGAPLSFPVNGTNADGTQIANDLTLLNQFGVGNDGGALFGDGSGGWNFNGKLYTSGVNVFDASAGNLALITKGNTNAIQFFTNGRSNELARFQPGSPGMLLQGGNASTVSSIQVGVAFGIMNSSGNHLFEVKSSGNTIALGQFQTAGTNSGIATSQPFDNFDMAEIYECDDAYEHGEVVCVNDEGTAFTRCTHDNCHCAYVISYTPGMQLGQMDEEKHVYPLALVGRVVCLCDGDITPRQLLCSAGNGKLRAMQPGESGFSIGFALNSSSKGKVGVCISRMYCVAR